jgi:chromosome segregation ATPase
LDIWQTSVSKDIMDLKADVEKLKEKASNHNASLMLHESAISGLKDSIKDIRDDTKWLRRAITNAFITALIGGAVVIVYAAMQAQ